MLPVLLLALSVQATVPMQTVMPGTAAAPAPAPTAAPTAAGVPVATPARGPAVRSAEAYRNEAVLAWQSGNIAVACHLLQQSVQAGAPLSVVDELGRCRGSEGNRPEAMNVYVALEQAAAAQNDQRWLVHAQAQQNSLAPSLARLTIKLEGAPQLGMTISDNRRPVPFSSLGHPRWVEPGAHDVVLTRTTGNLVRKTATLTGGQSAELTLSLAATPVAVTISDTGSAGRTWGSVVAGLGAASLGIGVALTVVGSNLVDEFDVACAQDLVDCTDPAFLSARDNGQSLVDAGIPMAIGGGVAVVAGIVLVVTHLPSNGPTGPQANARVSDGGVLDLQVTPWIPVGRGKRRAFSGGGLSVSGRF